MPSPKRGRAPALSDSAAIRCGVDEVLKAIYPHIPDGASLPEDLKVRLDEERQLTEAPVASDDDTGSSGSSSDDETEENAEAMRVTLEESVPLATGEDGSATGAVRSAKRKAAASAGEEGARRRPRRAPCKKQVLPPLKKLSILDRVNDPPSMGKFTVQMLGKKIPVIWVIDNEDMRAAGPPRDSLVVYVIIYRPNKKDQDVRVVMHVVSSRKKTPRSKVPKGEHRVHAYTPWMRDALTRSSSSFTMTMAQDIIREGKANAFLSENERDLYLSIDFNVAGIESDALDMVSRVLHTREAVFNHDLIQRQIVLTMPPRTSEEDVLYTVFKVCRGKSVDDIDAIKTANVVTRKNYARLCVVNEQCLSPEAVFTNATLSEQKCRTIKINTPSTCPLSGRIELFSVPQSERSEAAREMMARYNENMNPQPREVPPASEKKKRRKGPPTVRRAIDSIRKSGIPLTDLPASTVVSME